jgi:hypothetical protein
MGSLSRTAPLSIAATLVLLGCSSGSGTAPTNGTAAAKPSAWAVDPCVLVDATAPTADTLYTIGVSLEEGASSAHQACTVARPPGGAAPPVVIAVTVPPGMDLRELLDGAGGRRVDVIVTRDPAVLAYAKGHAGYLTAPMPWSVTYVLIPARANPSDAYPTHAERDALARDVVAVDARGAMGPVPWLTDEGCAAPASAPGDASVPVIAYAAGDATARQLAERIVSLAAAKPPAPWLAAARGDHPRAVDLSIAALSADLMTGALASGRFTAAVVPVGRDAQASCSTAGNAHVPAGALPLVDTRAHVIIRRGSGAAFTIGANGSLRFFRQSTR